MVKLRIDGRSALAIPGEPTWIPHLSTKSSKNTDAGKH